MSVNSSSSRREEAEAWWALIARILAFLLGGVILAVVALGNSSRLYAYVAGLALMGPMVANSVVTVAGGFAKLIEAARGAPPPNPNGEK